MFRSKLILKQICLTFFEIRWHVHANKVYASPDIFNSKTCNYELKVFHQAHNLSLK